MAEKQFLIVIADDDLDDLYIIQEAIRETGVDHKVLLLKNGLELMDMLLKRGVYEQSNLPVPDLIIMDLNMPLLDGYGVLKQIKVEEKLREIPVFVLSTSRFEYDRNKTLDYGANDFFSKPYHFDDLKVIVRDICNRTFEIAGGDN